MSHPKSRSAFTLLEIMIVVTIIAILAGMLLPNFIGFDKQAIVATTKSNLNTLRSRVTLFRAKTGHYPTSLQTLLDEKYNDAGVQVPYLKEIPTEMISDKKGNNEIEVATASAPLSGNGGWTYIKDTAEVVIDVSNPLGDEWEEYAGQTPSKW